MGIFVYTESADAAAVANLVRVFTQAGFQSLHNDAICAGRLLTFSRLNGGGIQLLPPEGDEKTSIMAVGSFYYRGPDATDGLRAFRSDVGTRHVDWEQVHGHFNLLLFDRDSLTVFADQVGTRPTYFTSDGKTISNSLVATCLLAGQLTPNPTAIERYIALGFTYGRQTFFVDINRCCAGYALERRANQTREVAVPLDFKSKRLGDVGLNEIADAMLAPLQQYMGWITKRAGGRMRAAVSSGFDSRLLLALMLDSGAKPILESYTDAEPWEPPLVEGIAKGEGLELEVLGGEQRARGFTTVVPYSDADVFKRHMIAEDGWAPSGLFGSGRAYFDRLGRSRSSTVLHGGAGEVFRNYFYLPSRRYTARDLTYFYDEGGWRPWMSAFGDRDAFLDDLAETIAVSIGCDVKNSLSREEVDRTYLYHRGQFYFGFQIDLNQRVGDMLFFFIDAANSWLAHQVPARIKSFGRLQSRMIARLNPRLAAYPSSYGFSFESGPSARYILRTVESYWRPIWLRRLLAKRRAVLGSQKVDLAQTTAEYGKVMDTGFPYLRKVIHVDQLNRRDEIDRAASVEYLFQFLNVAG